MTMVNSTLKNTRQSLVPLVPIVASGTWVKLILELPTREQFGELAIRRHQTFLFAAGEI
jgi:hypothetical protein